MGPSNELNRIFAPKPKPILFWGLFAAVFAVHLFWTALNTAPPAWDMAHHQIRGLETLEAWRQGKLPEDFSSLSDYYPPLYYLQEAVFMALLGPTRFVVPMSNLLGLFLLGFFTFRLAKGLFDKKLAQFVGVLPLILPMTAWLSRESLLDVSLAGWVTASAYLIIRSDRFVARGWSFAFGLSVAGGLLTKWTCGLFLTAPVIWALATSRDRRASLRNLTDSTLLALPFVLWWYLPNARSLISRFADTGAAAVAEQDPSFPELAAWIYYPRALASYYFYFVLAVLFVGGLAAWRRRRGEWPEAAVLSVWWLAGGWLLLTVLDAKDPRYMMPLVSPACLLLVAFWKHSRVFLSGLFAIAAAQFLAVSFSLPGGPYKAALFEYDPPGDYRTLAQEWVLFQSQYFDVTGPPRREDWHLKGLLDHLPNGARVGFVPEHPRFNPTTFRHAAMVRGIEVEVVRLGGEAPPSELPASLGYVIGKSGDQGIPILTQFNSQVYRQMKPPWQQAGEWELPDGSRGVLWRRGE